MSTKDQPKDRIYELLNGAAPLSKYIASKDTRRSRLLHYDESGDKPRNRAMRYSRNHESPYIDEQDDTAIVEPICFNSGALSVPKNNPSLQYFLSIHPGNESNGGSIFRLTDPERMAEERIADDEIRMDAMLACRQLDLDEKIALARTFVRGNIEKMSSKEIAYDLMRFAENNPETFLAALNDPDIDLNNIAARAIHDKYVIVKFGKDLYYNMGDNKKKIVTIPHGVKPEDQLSAWLVSDDGMDFYKQLSNIYSSED
jgi:hypothetical protein